MLEGKRIVITGASRGIGRAIALECARRGAIVGINYRSSQSQALALSDEIGARAVLLPFDVADAPAAERGLARFMDQHGGIDGLVNNAGINIPSLLVSAADDEVRDMIGANLFGPIVCTRAVLPAMLQQHAGVILNISSVAAERPAKGQSVYAATKGALESFTRAIAVEYGRKGIRCHCLRPGAIDTEMFAFTKEIAEEDVVARIPLRRLGSGQEVATFAAFLLSDDAAYVSGSIHAIDGGFGAG